GPAHVARGDTRRAGTACPGAPGEPAPADGPGAADPEEVHGPAAHGLRAEDAEPEGRARGRPAVLRPRGRGPGRHARAHRSRGHGQEPPPLWRRPRALPARPPGVRPTLVPTRRRAPLRPARRAVRGGRADRVRAPRALAGPRGALGP